MAMQVQSRQTEAQRWQAALDRAIDDALDVLVEPLSGMAFVESSNHPGVLYHVGATFCSCPAGRKNQVCKHRAVFLATIGELPGDPTPMIACARCFGSGRVPNDVEMRYDRCDRCGGSGVRPDHRLAGSPAVTIAA